jgi:hypothetical protein
LAILLHAIIAISFRSIRTKKIQTSILNASFSPIGAVLAIVACNFVVAGIQMMATVGKMYPRLISILRGPGEREVFRNVFDNIDFKWILDDDNHKTFTQRDSMMKGSIMQQANVKNAN